MIDLLCVRSFTCSNTRLMFDCSTLLADEHHNPDIVHWAASRSKLGRTWLCSTTLRTALTNGSWSDQSRFCFDEHFYGHEARKKIWPNLILSTWILSLFIGWNRHVGGVSAVHTEDVLRLKSFCTANDYEIIRNAMLLDCVPDNSLWWTWILKCSIIFTLGCGVDSLSRSFAAKSLKMFSSLRTFMPYNHRDWTLLTCLQASQYGLNPSSQM